MSVKVHIGQTESGLIKTPEDHLITNVGSISSPSDFEQFTLTVGTSEIAFPSATLTQVDEVTVQAVSTNTVSVVVGKTGVLSDLSNGGWELQSGTMIPLPSKDPTVLVAIASAITQKLLITYIKA